MMCLKVKGQGLMKLNEINFRDPFVLLDGDTYYMYGTRGERCWGLDDGLDCYTSKDLVEWEGPVEVFHRPEGFWADRNYWAPECHSYKGSYYIFASFKAEGLCRGTQILKADNPLGPFALHSDGPVTPRDWECLDGTFYVDKKGKPYMVFCHEWVQVANGTVCAVELAEDLSGAVSEPVQLFAAHDAPWVLPVNASEKNRALIGNRDPYVTDGPFLYRCEDGTLRMIWASFGAGGYAEACAKSLGGDIEGPWVQDDEPLFSENGGHGMVFAAKDGKKYLTLHAPNKTPLERPVFYRLVDEEGKIRITDEKIS